MTPEHPLCQSSCLWYLPAANGKRKTSRCCHPEVVNRHKTTVRVLADFSRCKACVRTVTQLPLPL